MNQILDAPVATEQKLQYAGFWIRVVASIIDGIVLSVIFFMLSLVLVGGAVAAGSMSMIIGVYILYYVLGFAYFTLMESSERQATLGKMAVGIKVGNELGQRLTAANALGRALSRMLSGLILCIGYLMVAFDVRKQGLHDKIASTVVYYA